eukprot:15880455-Heterocapsa_arctica.AAC.1
MDDMVERLRAEGRSADEILDELLLAARASAAAEPPELDYGQPALTDGAAAAAPQVTPPGLASPVFSDE